MTAPRQRAAARRAPEVCGNFLLRFARVSPRLKHGLLVPATTLAVVDLGSNSFRLEIGRVEGDQVYQLATWRETPFDYGEELAQVGCGMFGRYSRLTGGLVI